MQQIDEAPAIAIERLSQQLQPSDPPCPLALMTAKDPAKARFVTYSTVMRFSRISPFGSQVDGRWSNRIDGLAGSTIGEKSDLGKTAPGSELWFARPEAKRPR